MSAGDDKSRPPRRSKKIKLWKRNSPAANCTTQFPITHAALLQHTRSRSKRALPLVKRCAQQTESEQLFLILISPVNFQSLRSQIVKTDLRPRLNAASIIIFTVNSAVASFRFGEFAVSHIDRTACLFQ